jgi:hypothetical protein
MSLKMGLEKSQKLKKKKKKNHKNIQHTSDATNTSLLLHPTIKGEPLRAKIIS